MIKKSHFVAGLRDITWWADHFSFLLQHKRTRNLRTNTNLPSKLWPSGEAEPCSGLMTPSPAAGLCVLVRLFIPSCSSRRSPGRRTARSTSPFLCDSGSWICWDACSPAPSIRHALWDQSVVWETDATSSRIQQQLWQSLRWLLSRARKNRILQFREAAGFFHDLSDKTQPMTIQLLPYCRAMLFFSFPK